MRRLPARCWLRHPLGCLALLGALHAAPVSAGDASFAGPVTLPASMPLRRDEGPAVGASGWVPALALLVVAGAGGAWWWRRRIRDGGQRPRGRATQVVTLASRSLTPQASVHAIEWKGEEMLVACTAHNVTVLARRPMAQEEQSS